MKLQQFLLPTNAGTISSKQLAILRSVRFLLNAFIDWQHYITQQAMPQQNYTAIQ
ncbi:hypothetical protein [Tolypothrix sp. VBCCA 56010]|uniref:hypothetical protein n=1 Tax=Tolypothrix sp. VBCCA 56010 TaxID=3137731 RepID=UPI003D7C9220